MKKLIALCLFSGVLIVAQAANAALLRDDITEISTSLYGVYTSSDPTCATGLVPTLPVTSTPTSFNMAAAPRMGVGPVAAPLNCVIMVMRNNVTIGWKSGSYTSTTNGVSDSVCDSGGSRTIQVCRNNTTASWPAQIVADLAAVGVTATTSCPNTVTGNEVIPVYISVASACTGNAAMDAGTAGCVGGSGFSNNNAFEPPQVINDTARGINFNSPGVRPSYKFIIDPDQTVGAQSGVCDSLSPPRFSFAELPTT